MTVNHQNIIIQMQDDVRIYNTDAVSFIALKNIGSLPYSVGGNSGAISEPPRNHTCPAAFA
jgi:hypothetical protein